MSRTRLTDEYWSKLKPILLQQGVYDKPHLRITVEGIFCRMRTGCPWRDLPEAFGRWNTVYKRFNAWPPAPGSSQRTGIGLDFNGIKSQLGLEELCNYGAIAS